MYLSPCPRLRAFDIIVAILYNQVVEKASMQDKHILSAFVNNFGEDSTEHGFQIFKSAKKGGCKLL